MSSNPFSVCSILRVWVIGIFILFISMYELFVRVRAEYHPISSRGGEGGDAPYMWSRRWWVGLCVVGERIIELEIV